MGRASRIIGVDTNPESRVPPAGASDCLDPHAGSATADPEVIAELTMEGVDYSFE